MSKQEKPENIIKGYVESAIGIQCRYINPREGGEWMQEVEGEYIYLHIRLCFRRDGWVGGNRAPQYYLIHPRYGNWLGNINCGGTVGKPNNQGGSYDHEAMKKLYDAWKKEHDEMQGV